MKRHTWSLHHKWLGLILAFFICMFCLSGLVLNHQEWTGTIDVSRRLLPDDYRLSNWNKGLFKGTQKWHGRVLIFGNSGVWKADARGGAVSDFNQGMPSGMDNRNIRAMAVAAGNLFAVSNKSLFRRTPAAGWAECPMAHDDKLTDMISKGDSLLVIGRSYVYLSLPPYNRFRKLTLKAAPDSDHKVSLFRTVWLLHSGELFGWVGKTLVDLIALTLIFLSLTGVAFWLLPWFRKYNRWHTALRAFFLRWHDKVGRATVVLTLFIVLTGWFLRPPALVLIASARVLPVPFSTMANDNPWHDQLRALRFDSHAGDWLLYTARGFYSLHSLTAVPRLLPEQPPVSVMGANVLCQRSDGVWLVGSFSGLFTWNRRTGRFRDVLSPHAAASGPVNIPISEHPVAGYSADFSGKPLIVDYNSGTNGLKMPVWMSYLPMSLNHVCLEIHTGRIYTFLGKGNILYIFIIGLAIIWCLWSGWKLRSRKNRTGGA